MFNLIVDIGNTACKVAFVQEATLSKTRRYQGEDILEFILKVIGKRKPRVIIISSVRGKEEVLIESLKDRCKKIIFFDDKTIIPISNLYSTPKTLGSDRLASVVAAHKLFPDEDCMVLDFGTAITIDFINKKGEYQGGNISLGLRSRFIAMHQQTNNLPLINTPDEVREIGDSTDSAIEAGVILGIMFEIDGYIKRYPHCKIIFTGGDAIYFAKKVKNTIFVVCNLVLMGLSQIAKFNAID